MIKADIKGLKLEFETTSNLFSPAKIDAGTLAMLSCIEFEKGQKVLDLGCGCGVLGITAAKFTGPDNAFMVDVDQEAISCSIKNAKRNGVEEIHILKSNGLDALTESGFDLILCNPPYHTDFSVARRFIEKGFNRLKIGGRMLMVTKRKEWYKNKLTAIFGGAMIREIDGYYVFEAERRNRNYAAKRR